MQSIQLKDILTIVGLFFTAIALIKNSYEYSKAQKWKKLEFLAKEVTSFFANINVKRALLMLDWNGIDIQLDEGETYENTKVIWINDTILHNSLKHHETVPYGNFSQEEVIVRKIFDEFFFQLGIFNQYIKSGLIDIEELKPYLKYYIHALGQLESGRKDKSTIAQFWEYIALYEYTEVQELCKEFGYDITKI